jgi:hypothetical protein
VGLLSRKMYIGIKFPQIYIIRDTWKEWDTRLHGSQKFSTLLLQSAIIWMENRK